MNLVNRLDLLGLVLKKMPFKLYCICSVALYHLFAQSAERHTVSYRWQRWHNRPQDIRVHTDRAVDVLGDGLIWRLVLTADSQPNVAFIPLYQPAVSFHLDRQVEEQQCRNKEEEKQRRSTVSASHGVDLKSQRSTQKKEGKQRSRMEEGSEQQFQIRMGAGQG